MRDFMNLKSKTHISLAHTSKFNIYYEDTDFSGFVYHANYLKLFERSRSDMLGIGALKKLFTEGFHFVVTKAKLEFKAPARFGDEVICESRATISRSPRVQVEHILKSKFIDNPLVIGHIEIALLDNNNRPAQIPENFISYLETKN